MVKEAVWRRIANAVLPGLALALGGSTALRACGSFAVYADRPLYGMNWDYYQGTEGRIQVHRAGSEKVFCAYDDQGNDFTGMNTRGLFAAKQQVTPAEDFGALHDLLTLRVPRIEMKEVFRKALPDFGQVAEVDAFLLGRKLTYSRDPMHNLFADPGGRAEVHEVGRDRNMITPIRGRFLVMTNFSNYFYADVPYRTVIARGSERYIAGCDYAQKHLQGFDEAAGLGMLEAMKCEEVGFYTLCSFLFDPGGRCVYLAINRDFGKVWKVSIQDETIETFKGFEVPLKLRLSGLVRLSDLQALGRYDASALRTFRDALLVRPDPDAPAVKRGAASSWPRRAFAPAIVLLGLGMLAYRRFRRA